MDYYKKQYGLTITDSTQPMLVSNPKERRNAKPDAKKHFVTLIPEFCRMSGLSDEQISNFNVMKDVAQFTRVTPQQRVTALTQFIKNVKSCQKARDILSEWGLDFEDALLEISGRIVAAPNLEFNPNFTLKPGKPDFSREATTNACYRPVGLRRYIVLCTRNDRAKADNMVRTYKQVCGALGINTGAPGEVIAVNGNTPKDFRDALHEYIHPDKVQVVFVILPVPRDDLYAAVKKFCVVERPIPSQVVLSKTLNNEKRIRSVMQKIALQVNCKLGGALWALKIPMAAKIMFCGVDVYHDPKRKNPSVTAFVASMDTSCTSYYSRVIFQKPHQENLDSLIAVFVNALEEFRDINGTLPDRVIVFRDGVSDGQWETVKETEVKQLTNGLNIALANEPGKNCLFSFVVVQKKINERFFALNGRKVDNPVPGSVVDNTVNRRYFYDFFIVSQLVRQGTVSPTHFIVLEDTSNIKPDLIQKFAFATTFMYFNWPGTIRVPAMCQYAHKLAYLTGQHVKSEPAASHCHSLYYL
jgi:aubergine-like protein